MISQSSAYVRGWQPSSEQNKMSQSIPFRVGAGASRPSTSKLASAVQAAGWSGIGSFDFAHMTQSQMDEFIGMLQSSGMSPQDSRLLSVISAAQSSGLRAAPWSGGGGGGGSSSGGGGGSGGGVPSSPAAPAPVADNSAWIAAQQEMERQRREQEAAQQAAIIAEQQRQFAEAQAAAKAYQDQQIAIQQQQAAIAKQQADAKAAADAAQLAWEQQQAAELKARQDAAAAAEAKRIQDEKDAYEKAHAPRWVQSQASRFDPTRSPVQGATAADMVTLPDGRQMTREQAYQRGWRVTTTPEDYGADQASLGQKQTVYLQVNPSQMAATRQYIAGQGGSVGAAYGGLIQAIVPAGAIDKLYDIPGVQIYQGGGSSTAASYLPSGYDSSTGTTLGEQSNQIATDTEGTGFETAQGMGAMQGRGTVAQQPVQNRSANSTGSQLAQRMTQGQNNVTESVGGQLAQSMGAQTQGATSGWGSFAPILNAPPIPDWQTWQNMTPFEKASYRVLAESAGPWEQQQQKMREKWAQSGITATPDQTRLTAASMQPRDILGLNFTAETFGEKPDDFWQRQSKTWSTADAGNTSIAGGGRGIRTRRAVIGA